MSPVTIIIIYSLQCTLLLRKRATGCSRVPRIIASELCQLRNPCTFSSFTVFRDIFCYVQDWDMTHPIIMANLEIGTTGHDLIIFQFYSYSSFFCFFSSVYHVSHYWNTRLEIILWILYTAGSMPQKETIVHNCRVYRCIIAVYSIL